MRSFQVSIAVASCTLMLSAGVAFADDLHKIMNTTTSPSIVAPHSPGQTGSNVLASCGSTAPFFSIGTVVATGAPVKSNTGTNSPFNPNAPAKEYAGNTGNPATNPTAVSQYDNACAQAAIHAGQVP